MENGAVDGSQRDLYGSHRDLCLHMQAESLSPMSRNTAQAAELPGLSVRTIRNKLKSYRAEDGADGRNSDVFRIAGVPIVRDAAVVEAGLDFAVTTAATLGIAYGGQFGTDMTAQSLKANLNVRF